VLWKIEKGIGNPTYTTILDIADALGVSEHMLLPPRSLRT
jgi:transcriptional regulator with XRE-family HTH domain